MVLGVVLVDAMDNSTNNDEGLRQRFDTSEKMVKQVSFNFYDNPQLGKLVSFNTNLESLEKDVRDYLCEQYPDIKRFYTICDTMMQQYSVEDQDYFPESHILLVTLEHSVSQEKIQQLLKNLPDYAVIRYYEYDQSKRFKEREVVKVMTSPGCVDNCIII